MRGEGMHDRRNHSWTLMRGIGLAILLALATASYAGSIDPRTPYASGTYVRISLSTEGTIGDGQSGDPSVSDDGRYVAFFSTSSNLVPGDTNGRGDIFLKD